MVKVLSDHFITGACHAPVDSRQGESLVRCSREVVAGKDGCCKFDSCGKEMKEE